MKTRKHHILCKGWSKSAKPSKKQDRLQRQVEILNRKLKINKGNINE